MFPFTNIRLTSRFNFVFFTFSVTIQTTRASNTKYRRQLSCSTLYSCCYRDPRYSSDDTAGLAFLGVRTHPVPCMPEECKQKAVSTTYTCISPYRVYGNPARSCNSFDLRYSNPSAKRDNWVIMSKGDVTFSPVIFASKKWMKNLWCTPS